MEAKSNRTVADFMKPARKEKTGQWAPTKWRPVVSVLSLVLWSSVVHAATFVVDRSDDANVSTCSAAANDCTLRGAINAANVAAGADVITFGGALSRTPSLKLVTKLPTVNETLRITGPGANLLSIEENDANQSFAIFEVSTGVDATFSGLTIAKGLVGIYNFGTATITNCAASGNAYGFDNFTNGNPTNPTMTVKGCTVSGNTNTGIFSDGTATITNSTVTGNGNGINININSTATIANCTVSGNSNYGIYNPGAAATIKNTIATNNPTGDVSGGASGTFTSGGYNLIGNGSAAPGFSNSVNGDQVGTNAAPLDAKLGALADNGGPTQTMALLSGSPALDAGNSSFSSDQRGYKRPVDVSGVSNVANGSDIGAFELDPAQSGSTLVVNSIADHDDGTCGTGDCTLREAILYSAVDDTITFKSGLSGTIKLTLGQLDIIQNVTVSGPGASTVTVSGNNRSRVLAVSDGTVSISGLTIANGGGGLNVGGGVVNNRGTLTLSNCVITGNSAGDGGGVYNNRIILVTDCTFLSNFADYGGGGLFNDGYEGNAQATLTNCTFDSNTTGGSGAAIYSNGDGIAVPNLPGSATLTITDSRFSNNIATNSGGGIVTTGNNGSATLDIKGSTFDGNSAANGSGGGIFINSGSTTATNSTFASNNSSNSGGGIYNLGRLTVNSNTFSGNSTTGFGGGIFSDANAILNLDNSIVAGNTATTDGADISGTLAAGDYNLVQDISGVTLTGTHNITGQDPKLGALADNAGPTQTMALQIDSPAIDAGNDANAPATDQRGIARPQGAHSDIGAFEFDKYLILSIAPLFSDTFAENAGANATKVRITRGGDLTNALSFDLRSSDTTEATIAIASHASIAAGQSYVDVPVNAVDDAIADGTQSVLIKATATGYLNQKITLTVTDDEAIQPSLSLRLLPAGFSEAKSGTAATLVVQHNRVSTTTSVTVNLRSTDARLNLPNSVPIPVGKRSVEVAVTVTADSILTGTKNATITATATNFTSANTTATIYDAQARITLSLAPSQSNTISEGTGNNQTTLRVTRNTPTTGALVVNLSLNKGAGQVSYPASVAIPDGAAYTDFTVSAIDDSVVDGTQSVVVVASATGYGSSTAQLYVKDNDGAAAMSTFKAPDEPSK